MLCLLHWKLYTTLDTTYKPYKNRIITAKNNNNTIMWLSYLFLSVVYYLRDLFQNTSWNEQASIITLEK